MRVEHPPCAECGGPGDDRTGAGMKCGPCAYGRARGPGRSLRGRRAERVMLCARGEWSALRRMPDAWLYEPKLDGTRILAEKRGETVRLTNRRGARKKAAFPEVAGALRSIPGDFLLDGELCVTGGGGRADFSLLAARDRLTDPTRIRLLSLLHPATYFAFDLLRRDGRDLTRLPLRERKGELGRLLGGLSARWGERLATESQGLPPRVALVLPGRREALREMAERGEIEGVVAKDPNSTYEFRRSPRWVKFRREETEDLPVVGFEESDRPGRSGVRSLLCLRYGREVGVASGLSRSDLEAVARTLRARPHREAPGESGRKRIYLEGAPLPVAEVSFYDDPSMAIRFPRFLRLKEGAET